MAVPSIKSTYSLDVETVRTLDRLAQHWKVTKSEALRRAIRASASAGSSEVAGDALQALDHLQRALKLDVGAAGKWAQSAQQERMAAATRRGRRTR